MKHLRQEVKEAIAEKALNRKDKTLVEIANENNIGLSTLQRWVQRYSEGGTLNTKGISASTVATLSRAEQFKHLLATSKLDDVGLGAYCRERGLYSFQLQQWKNEFMSHDNKQKNHEAKAEIKSLRTENKLLKQDLYRKDKALAETTALLVLKKKQTFSLGT